MVAVLPAVEVSAHAPRPIRDIAGQWWIAQTHPQRERRFAAAMASAGVGYFLPLQNYYRRYDHRRGIEWRLMERPLFPRYVFFAGDAGARYEATCTGMVFHIIDVVRQAKLVEELATVELALAHDPFTLSVPGTLKAGVLCRVTSGPYKNYEGSVDFFDGRHHLVIRLETMGQSVAVTIEPSHVESLE
jgi:transcription antitermination factor NusG